MDQLLTKLAQAKAASRDRRESFIRISPALMAEIVSALLGREIVTAGEQPEGKPEGQPETVGQ